MFRKSQKSQAGFSLVELMVVVAIIGVLASIAVPSINKYLAKARQTEAKTQLSSLYTSEKAFYAEYTTYDPRFVTVGYAPEGQLRYNVGFSACAAVAGPANGYNVQTQPANNCSTSTYCPTANSGCTMLNGANGGAAPAVPASTLANATTFLAGAAARISSSASAAADSWTVDNTKVFRNTVNGIP